MHVSHSKVLWVCVCVFVYHTYTSDGMLYSEQIVLSVFIFVIYFIKHACSHMISTFLSFIQFDRINLIFCASIYNAPFYGWKCFKIWVSYILSATYRKKHRYVHTRIWCVINMLRSLFIATKLKIKRKQQQQQQKKKLIYWFRFWHDLHYGVCFILDLRFEWNSDRKNCRSHNWLEFQLLFFHVCDTFH